MTSTQLMSANYDNKRVSDQLSVTIAFPSKTINKQANKFLQYLD